MQVSWKGIDKGAAALAVIGGLSAHAILNTLTIREHQRAISAMVEYAAVDVEAANDTNKKLWDLHRRVVVLERENNQLVAEDQRLLAHIRWFVMRRSGTDELRKMEAAIERLEADD